MAPDRGELGEVMRAVNKLVRTSLAATHDDDAIETLTNMTSRTDPVSLLAVRSAISRCQLLAELGDRRAAAAADALQEVQRVLHAAQRDI
jgi:hypothetical protein